MRVANQQEPCSTDYRVASVAGLAARYCRLIERSGSDERPWLPEVAELLPRLHAALWSLGAGAAHRGRHAWADLDARFELYVHLLTLLGERDGYWLEFDRAGDEQAMTGSLADDLTDIYCELKEGLALLAADPQWAIHGWLSGYAQHWGQHLVDAERHLATLSARGCLT